MEQFELKYGCNPNQTPALLSRTDGPLPFTVLNGRPGYINLLDALHSHQMSFIFDFFYGFKFGKLRNNRRSAVAVRATEITSINDFSLIGHEA